MVFVIWSGQNCGTPVRTYIHTYVRTYSRTPVRKRADNTSSAYQLRGKNVFKLIQVDLEK
jgi:hypothetical protein